MGKAQPDLCLPLLHFGRVTWWKSRISLFPNLAPVAIAYLLTPRSAVQADRTFIILRYIQASDRLHMTDDTVLALAFLYINKSLIDISV